jgi:hypothetical protein
VNDQEAHKHLNGLFLGFLTAKCIQMAGELRIANELADGPLSIDEIARRTGTRPGQLYRVLRHLASNGIFQEEGKRTFSLNASGRLLRTDIAGSYFPFAKLIGDLDWRPAEDLIVALKDGKVPFDHHFGKPAFAYVMEKPELVSLFNDAMHGFSWPATEAILESCDFSDVDTLADIAGGNGDILVGVLQKYSSLRGILFDRPEVVARSTAVIDGAGLADRCKLVGGDFFESIPVQSDAYFLRHILHDWSDDECVAILKNLAKAAPPNARLFIAECMIGKPNENSLATSLDILMLVALTGRERTAEEYGELLDSAGFRLESVTPTASVVSVLEASLA